MNMKKNKFRLKFSFFVIVLAFLVFAVRAVQYHILDRNIIKEQSDIKMTSTIPIQAKRGDILDRNGKILATSIRKYYVIVNHTPNQINESALKIIEKHCPTADLDDIKNRMLNSKLENVKVIDSLSFAQAEGLLSVETPKIGVYPFETRVYPNAELASQVIGFCRTDGVGQLGLEYEFDEELSGINGYIKSRTDSMGRKLALSDSQKVEAVDGHDVYTTLDLTIQYFAEQAIKKGRKATGAKAVMAIVQDTKSGEILAMAANPSFDLNNPYEVIDEDLKAQYELAKTNEEASAIIQRMWRNPNISDVFEPGSIFKIFIALAGLDNGKYTKDSSFYCGGLVDIDENKIRCWVYPNSHGALNFTSAFAHSCNAAFMDIAIRLGASNIYDYLEAFRLNEPTGIELPGEAAPILLNKSEIRKVDLARIGFGHSVTFTPIQMMSILSTIGNDGELILPTVIKSVENKNKEKVKIIRERNVGRIISSQSAREVREMMDNAVTSGLSGIKQVKGYKIGGKTGTTTKFKVDKYSDKKIVASFLASVPIENPAINIIVVVDEPDENLASGSRAAAPIAAEIIFNVMNYLGVSPNEHVESEVFALDNYVGMTLATANEKIQKSGLKLNVINQAQIDKIKAEKKKSDADFIVEKQYPIGGTMVSKDDEISVSVVSDGLQ